MAHLDLGPNASAPPASPVKPAVPKHPSFICVLTTSFRSNSCRTLEAFDVRFEASVTPWSIMAQEHDSLGPDLKV